MSSTISPLVSSSEEVVAEAHRGSELVVAAEPNSELDQNQCDSTAIRDPSTSAPNRSVGGIAAERNNEINENSNDLGRAVGSENDIVNNYNEVGEVGDDGDEVNDGDDSDDGDDSSDGDGDDDAQNDSDSDGPDRGAAISLISPKPTCELFCIERVFHSIFFGGDSLSLFVDSPVGTLYLPGDIINGRVEFHATASRAVKNIQVYLSSAFITVHSTSTQSGRQITTTTLSQSGKPRVQLITLAPSAVLMSGETRSWPFQLTISSRMLTLSLDGKSEITSTKWSICGSTQLKAEAHVEDAWYPEVLVSTSVKVGAGVYNPFLQAKAHYYELQQSHVSVLETTAPPPFIDATAPFTSRARSELQPTLCSSRGVIVTELSVTTGVFIAASLRNSQQQSPEYTLHVTVVEGKPSRRLKVEFVRFYSCYGMMGASPHVIFADEIFLSSGQQQYSSSGSLDIVPDCWGDKQTLIPSRRLSDECAIWYELRVVDTAYSPQSDIQYPPLSGIMPIVLQSIEIIVTESAVLYDDFKRIKLEGRSKGLCDAEIGADKSMN